MGNSSLVNCTIKSPTTNYYGKRTHAIDRITPHCVVGQLAAETIGNCFLPTTRGASCNYGIGTDGRVVLCVDEDNASGCSSSKENDERAVTIECASGLTEPYEFNDKVYNKLIDLCVDICQRHGKKKLLWLKDKNTSINYNPKSDEMVLTVHRWFSDMRSCPGTWLMERMDDLANKVTARLGGGGNTTTVVPNPNTGKTDCNCGCEACGGTKLPYLIQVVDPPLNIRKGPGTNYAIVGKINNTAKYTIVEEDATKQWLKLKSGAGWISADYTKKVDS